jgi:transcriptional regulator with XRE-family HTH domain
MAMSDQGVPYVEASRDEGLTTVGARIRWARKRQGKTQDELAQAFPKGREKKRAVIGQYESGGIVPSLEVIGDLASILQVEPSFLAFGEGPAQTIQTRALPLDQDENDEPDPEHLIVPLSMLADLGVEEMDLKVVRLEVEAPLFGLGANDYVLVDVDRATMASDGLIYAVQTSAGPALVRSEPLLTRSSSKTLQLKGGQGESYTAASDDLEVLGCVVASIQKKA